MKTRRSGILDAAVLFGIVAAAWALIEFSRRRSLRLQRALASFAATYQFSAGKATRRLVFADGRAKIKCGSAASPDYELILLDPCGAVKQILMNPDDVLRLMVENKIDQRGNHYFLLKFGYLLNLSLCCLGDLLTGFVPPAFRKNKCSEV